MDSTMVDYAIGKLNDAFTQIAPSAINLGNEFISYTVFKAVVLAITLPLIAGILAYISFRLLSEVRAIIKEKGNRYTNNEEVPYAFGGFIIGGVGLVLTIVSFDAIYNGILAAAYPLMFTLESLTK